ncbi:MAG: hypothetical protein ACNA7J_03725 [Wenzhouxiangella sp.]
MGIGTALVTVSVIATATIRIGSGTATGTVMVSVTHATTGLGTGFAIPLGGIVMDFVTIAARTGMDMAAVMRAIIKVSTAIVRRFSAMPRSMTARHDWKV